MSSKKVYTQKEIDRLMVAAYKQGALGLLASLITGFERIHELGSNQMFTSKQVIEILKGANNGKQT